MTTLLNTGESLVGVAAPSNASDAVLRCAQTLLKRVFRILRGCGFSETQLREMANEAVRVVEQTPDAQRSRVTARQAMMCCDVVLKWRRDCGYLDDKGEPAILPMVGDAHSFTNLVGLSAPGADPIEVLTAMSELGVVRTTQDKRIELISESVVTCSGKDGLAIAGECVLEHICGFLGSVEFNVFDKPSRAKGRFERACYATVSKELVPVLQQLVRSRGQDFVDAIDEWLARRSSNVVEGAQGVLVGAGAYVFVREMFD
jgi:hypothetical protein